MRKLFQSKLLIFPILVLMLIAIGVFFINSNRNITLPITSNQPDSQKISVLASFYPYVFLVEKIGGEKVEVTGIVPPGIEPHDFELTTQQLIDIQNSNLLVLNGVLEPWANDIKQSLTSSKTIILQPGISEMKSENQEIDPHVWLSPVVMQVMATEISLKIQEIDPVNSTYYQQNTEKLIENLKELDNKFKKGLQICKRRDLITTHVAFSYLSNEYDLNQIGIAGLSPDSEPSFQKLQELTLFAKKNNLKYIFFEETVSPKFAQTIANEVGAETLVLNPVETLSSDELQLGEDYLSVMYENLTQLRLALECQ